MANRIRTIKRWEAAFDQRAEYFVFRHPLLGLLGMFVGVPILILIVVCAGTTIVMLAVSWMRGLL